MTPRSLPVNGRTTSLSCYCTQTPGPYTYTIHNLVSRPTNIFSHSPPQKPIAKSNHPSLACANPTANPSRNRTIISLFFLFLSPQRGTTNLLLSPARKRPPVPASLLNRSTGIQSEQTVPRHLELSLPRASNPHTELCRHPPAIQTTALLRPCVSRYTFHLLLGWLLSDSAKGYLLSESSCTHTLIPSFFA